MSGNDKPISKAEQDYYKKNPTLNRDIFSTARKSGPQALGDLLGAIGMSPLVPQEKANLGRNDDRVSNIVLGDTQNFSDGLDMETEVVPTETVENIEEEAELAKSPEMNTEINKPIENPKAIIKEKNMNNSIIQFDLHNPITWLELSKILQTQLLNKENNKDLFTQIADIFSSKPYAELGITIAADRPKRQQKELFRYSYDTIINNKQKASEDSSHIFNTLQHALVQSGSKLQPKAWAQIFNEKNIKSYPQIRFEYEDKLADMPGQDAGWPVISIDLPYCQPADAKISNRIEAAVSFIVGQHLALLTPLMPRILIRINFQKGSKELIPEGLINSIDTISKNMAFLQKEPEYGPHILIPSDLTKYCDSKIEICAQYGLYSKYIRGNNSVFRVSGNQAEIRGFLGKILLMETIISKKITHLKASQIQTIFVKCSRRFGELKGEGKGRDEIEKINPYGEYDKLFESDTIVIHFDVLMGDKTTKKIQDLCNTLGGKKVIITTSSSFDHDHKHDVCKSFLQNIAPQSRIKLGGEGQEISDKDNVIKQIVVRLLERTSSYRPIWNYDIRNGVISSMVLFLQEFNEKDLPTIIGYFEEHQDRIYDADGARGDVIKDIFKRHQLEYSFNHKKMSNLVEDFIQIIEKMKATDLIKLPDLDKDTHKMMEDFKNKPIRLEELRERLHISVMERANHNKSKSEDERCLDIAQQMKRSGFWDTPDIKRVRKMLKRSSDGYMNGLINYYYFVFLEKAYVDKVFQRTLQRTLSQKESALKTGQLSIVR